MIQGGGPCRSSPEGHTLTRQVRRQRITIKQREVSLYSSSTLRRENRAENTQIIPTSRGHAHMTVQHDAGHPNSPTIHQTTHHHSPHKRVVVPEHEAYPDQIKTTQKRKPSRRLTNTTLFIRAPVSADATYRLGGQSGATVK